eukprot:CAMPEP_0178435796 /NCGR_PEP_ID=MMETSP0689_2-20121128/34113_1 /TAXON_ID=160604 /ORGANISM="Amphidinium massartii, Strain CS-259" /LENGTH=410 /DNA_ID=CAMNT_0020057881 /DNA_START=5 /DNA_END=1233 /DNA_ORIENTATION=+
MTKRSSGFDVGPGDGGPEKAPRLTGVSESSPQVSDYYVEQNLVGWVLGQRGGSLREVELTHQVKVVIDQTTKNMGYSSVRIAGSKDRIAESVKQIEASLARMSSRPGPFLKDKPPSVDGPPEGQGELETIKVEQRLVGWIVGKGGSACREIEAASGCKITINQETKNLGYSMVMMRGSNAQRAVAREKVNGAIQRAAQRVGIVVPKEPDDSAKEEELMQVYMQAAQQQLLPDDIKQEQQRQQSSQPPPPASQDALPALPPVPAQPQPPPPSGQSGPPLPPMQAPMGSAITPQQSGSWTGFQQAQSSNQMASQAATPPPQMDTAKLQNALLQLEQLQQQSQSPLPPPQPLHQQPAMGQFHQPPSQMGLFQQTQTFPGMQSLPGLPPPPVPQLSGGMAPMPPSMGMLPQQGG